MPSILHNFFSPGNAVPPEAPAHDMVQPDEAAEPVVHLDDAVVQPEPVVEAQPEPVAEAQPQVEVE